LDVFGVSLTKLKLRDLIGANAPSASSGGSKEGKKVEDNWECSMNTDKERSNCEEPEEDIEWIKPPKSRALKIPSIPEDVESTIPENSRIVVIGGEAVQVTERPRRNVKAPPRYEDIQGPTRKRKSMEPRASPNKRVYRPRAPVVVEKDSDLSDTESENECTECKGLSSRIDEMRSEIEELKGDLEESEEKNLSLVDELRKAKEQHAELYKKLQGSEEGKLKVERKLREFQHPAPRQKVNNPLLEMDIN